MRMRARRHLDERMAACQSWMVLDEGVPFFQNGAPVHLEIGCGKGGFITTLAKQNPGINFLAAERYTNVLVLAMEKAKEENLTNLAFLQGDVASHIPFLQLCGIERIYLNFSDPWPKKGHAKRRLTHNGFLALYKSFLPPGGEIHMKTDNQKLFEFSLNTFSQEDFKLRNITFDLHNSDFVGNIMTEYEKNFSQQGMPIYRLEAVVR